LAYQHGSARVYDLIASLTCFLIASRLFRAKIKCSCASYLLLSTKITTIASNVIAWEPRLFLKPGRKYSHGTNVYSIFDCALVLRPTSYQRGGCPGDWPLDLRHSTTTPSSVSGNNGREGRASLCLAVRRGQQREDSYYITK